MEGERGRENNHFCIFRTSTGATTRSLTAGLVSNINFWMNLTNTRDDAFLTQITFILDSSFELVRVEPRSVSF